MKTRIKLTFENAMAKAAVARGKAEALKIMSNWAAAELVDRRRRATDAKVEAVLIADSAGDPVRVIAEKVDLSEPTVRRILANR